MTSAPIRVLVIDDSRFIRQLFSEYLSQDTQIQVVGSAGDPYEAREMIKRYNPDVVTLDVEMPKMDGLTFLEKIMTLRPMPVVMVSTLTRKGAETTLRALELGAVDYLAKPANLQAMEAIRRELVRKVKLAAIARVKSLSKAAPREKMLHFSGNATKWLIAIGASTGGVEALRELLAPMPANLPPIVISQHMPAEFTGAFARRLNGLLAPTVLEAAPQQVLQPGHVYVAAGGHHLLISRENGRLIGRHGDGPLVSGHKPSVDAMFESIAMTCPAETIGIILTGMGHDGATGLKALSDRGARTIGQDEASAIVYGMPRAAAELGAVQTQLPLERIAPEIVSIANS